MLRKCPIALKGGFKSSYIRFFMTKQPVIKEELGGNTNVMDWNQGHPVLVWIDITFIMLKRSLIAPLNTIWKWKDMSCVGILAMTPSFIMDNDMLTAARTSKQTTEATHLYHHGTYLGTYHGLECCQWCNDDRLDTGRYNLLAQVDLGPTCIEQLFRWAYECYPRCTLLYNDNKVEGIGTYKSETLLLSIVGISC